MIYRAAAQWFVRMDEVDGAHQGQGAADAARDRRSHAIEETAFYPAKGPGAPARHDRQPARLVLSRQRSWGVPLPFFLHKETRRAASAHAGAARPRGDSASNRAASRRGSASTPQELLGADAERCTRRASDILDVWFDSGTTHSTCCAARTRHADEQRARADLYLEGHDQHRGWFHSSLLIACAMYGRAPYAACSRTASRSTAQGRKMSKTLGNVIAPQEIVGQARRRDHPPVGGRRPTTRATSRSTTRSWRAWSKPTAASATRCASCWPTRATSIRRSDAVPLAEMLEIDR